MSTPRLAMLALAVAALLPGCGDDRAEGPRVVVVLSSVDRPGPKAYRLRSFSEEGVTYPLVPVPEAGPDVYEAEDAPDGPYALEGDEGWAMVWPQRLPPDLRRSAPEPLRIQLGRSHTLYLARDAHDYRFSRDWAASTATVPPSAILLTAEIDDQGVAVIRVPKERWGGHWVVFGRLEGGGVTKPVPFDLAESGNPRLRSAAPAQTLPLRVHVFHELGMPVDVVSRTSVAPAQIRVRVEIAGLPLPVSYESAVQGDGTASFGGIPYLEHPLRVSSEAFGGAYELDPASWRVFQELRVALPGDEEAKLRVDGAPAALEIQARPAAGLSYALVPFTRSGDEVTLRLPPGDVRLLLRAGDRWAETRRPAAGSPWNVPFSEFRAATRVQMPLRGAVDGRVALFRVEDGHEVLAQGLTLGVRGDAEVAATVPPGTYRISWKSSAGQSRHPATHTMEPGGQKRVPLDAK